MSQQEQLLAFAVYEIRLLLASHLGSESSSDLSIRTAAHLAYALHNEADAAIRGQYFDAQKAFARLGTVDKMLGSDLQNRFSQATGREA